MVFYILLKFNVFVVCCLVSCSHGKCTNITVVKTQWIKIQTIKSCIDLPGFRSATGDSREATHVVTTEWPWPWHPDIHWYHPYLNLSLDGPEIWEALHVGVLTARLLYNDSHVRYKWFAQLSPDFSDINKLYKEQYEGTDRNMTICMPFVLGAPYPDWATRDYILGCVNYVPENYAHVYRLKNMGFVYNREKPLVDVLIGLGTIVTALGIPGKLLS